MAGSVVGRRTRARGWGVVLVTLACLGAGCGKGGDTTTAPETQDTIGDEGQPSEGGSLVIGVAEETSGWNPTIDRWAQSGALVGSAVLEPLATLDSEGAAQPFLASAW